MVSHWHSYSSEFALDYLLYRIVFCIFPLCIMVCVLSCAHVHYPCHLNNPTVNDPNLVVPNMLCFGSLITIVTITQSFRSYCVESYGKVTFITNFTCYLLF
ncbi:hypothetical protein RND81_10G078200 [Saponaria officinalis]|uniref:Uncharacterized protein n=1 Tax=Saponaria officinalis TaxID=3572 RepID=A0AAW1HZ81_SAPOF